VKKQVLVNTFGFTKTCLVLVLLSLKISPNMFFFENKHCLSETKIAKTSLTGTKPTYNEIQKRLINSSTMGSGGNKKLGTCSFWVGTYVPMEGIQFGRIISFSLTKHTWELKVTSEVERKMTLMGHQISCVIYYQLQGHYTIIFNVFFSFSISERTDVAFF